MAARPVTLSGSAVRRLRPQPVAAPWGRRRLGPWGLGLDRGDVTIGEVHHLGDDDAPLLVKTLFTGERLSVQVHPDDAAAARVGLARGKDEAWVVLAAEPGATIGLGLQAPCDADTLRAAALDGSIVDRMCWHDCAAGDVFFAPAGTIHAIGAGVTLFEVQQNCAVTYRLFDYGRGRPLHLDEGLAVARAMPWSPTPQRRLAAREVLAEGPAFVMERVCGAGVVTPDAGPVWVAAIGAGATVDGAAMAAGEVWLIEAPAAVTGDAELVLAYSGAAAVPGLWRG